ncbi:MAG: glycosyltransferase family 4 protein [Pseudomonadota bacterium]
MVEEAQLVQGAHPGPKAGRVLLLAPQPFYDNRGTPIAVRFVVEALSELGYEVDLITLPFGSDIDVPGLNIIRLPNLIGARKVAIGFSLAKLAFAVMMLATVARRLRRHRYDCVHAVEEAALMTALCSRKGRPPMIYDMASSLPEQMSLHGWFKKLPIAGLFRGAERLMLARSSAVIASAGLEIEKDAAVPQRCRFVWRFPALEIDPVATSSAELRDELRISADAPILLYTGNFAGYQGVNILLEALPYVIRAVPNVMLIMIGAQNSTEIASLTAKLSKDDLKHLRLLPQVERRELAQYLHFADVLVSPRAYGKNFPLKIFDYLAAEKPIVATDIKAHTCVLDASLAQLTETTSKGLAEGIKRVLDDDKRAYELAQAAAAYAQQNLRWEGFVNLIRTLYETARKDPGSRASTDQSSEELKAMNKIGA